MSIVSGIVSSCTVDDSTGTPQDISSDTFSATIALPRNQQDITTIDKTAMARLGLLYDCTVTLTGGTDFATGKSHDVFKADPASNATRTVTIVLAGSSATLAGEFNRSDYGPARAQDGSLTWTATLVLADGNPAAWT